jgi:hypothetical protein
MTSTREVSKGLNVNFIDQSEILHNPNEDNNLTQISVLNHKKYLKYIRGQLEDIKKNENVEN